MFPTSNPWNQDISGWPVDPKSSAYIQTIDALGNKHFLHPDFGSDPSYGIPYSIVPATQPRVPVLFNQSPTESDPGPYPIPLNAPVEAGSDQHVIAL
ncbi:MAG TPA: hypothetical protein VIX82_06445, partial [Solirubrobacteraceae bacterium]